MADYHRPFQGAADFDLELIESRTLDSNIQELTTGSACMFEPVHAPANSASRDRPRRKIDPVSSVGACYQPSRRSLPPLRVAQTLTR